MEEYFIVSASGQGEIIEKKSRFIAYVFPVISEEQALFHIGEIKKRHWDARHNCFAFTLGNRNEVQRFSDDGEPQGTAGKPILDVLNSINLHNTLIVVTRYFGGILLGTGGLVRAYGKAAKEGLKNTETRQVFPGVRFRLTTDYNSLGKIRYIMEQAHIRPEAEDYGTDVVMQVVMKQKDFLDFQTRITDITSAGAEFTDITQVEYLEKTDLFI